MDHRLLQQTVDLHFMESNQKRRAASNNASQIGHPCSRFLFYRRHPEHYLYQSDYGLETMHRFWIGAELEKSCLRLLMDAGIDVLEQQKSVEYPDYQVAGQIDLKIRNNGEIGVFEIKTVQDNLYGKIFTADDLLKTGKYYYGNYYHQLNWYLLMEGLENGGFILINKVNGDLKFVPMQIDIASADAIGEKLLAVNKALAEDQIPPAHNDAEICPFCTFRDHCCPPVCQSEEWKPSDNLPPETYDLLTRYRELHDLAAEYKQVDVALK